MSLQKGMHTFSHSPNLSVRRQWVKYVEMKTEYYSEICKSVKFSS